MNVGSSVGLPITDPNINMQRAVYFTGLRTCKDSKSRNICSSAMCSTALDDSTLTKESRSKIILKSNLSALPLTASPTERLLYHHQSCPVLACS